MFTNSKADPNLRNAGNGLVQKGLTRNLTVIPRYRVS